MFSYLLKARRAAKRALKVRARRTLSQHPRRERAVRLSLFLGAILATGLLYPQSDLFSPVHIPREGNIAREDFIAPTVITLKKTPAELAEERELAKNASPIVLDYDSTVVDSALGKMRYFFSKAMSIKASMKPDSTADFGAFAETLTRDFPYMSSLALTETFNTDSLQVVMVRLEDILADEIYFNGVLKSLEPLEKEPTRPVVMRAEGRDIIVNRDEALDLNRAHKKLLDALNRIARDTVINVELHYEIGRHFIFANLDVAVEETNRRQAEAVARVSEIKRQGKEGDLVIRAGQVGTREDMEIVQEYAAQLRRLAIQESFFKANLPLLVRLLIIAIIFGLLYLYLKIFREDIYRSVPKLIAVFMLVAVELFAVYICESQGLNVFVYPVAVAPIMYAVLFDTRFGVISALFLSVLLGALLRMNFDMTLIAVTAGSIGAYSVSGVRARSQLFRTMVYLGVVGILLVLSLGYLNGATYARYTEDAMFALVAAVVTPILAAGLLPFFESLFGFTTDITLLELSDLNRPLLKRLALEAPGTFHHSIVVGSLAESAAKAIGANSLLARVGAYYHDIGKMDIAEYFIENQVGIKSKHDTITPSMSAIILASHVKRGRQIAEEADLPDDVMNFIEEHHGTMIMRFFYQKALDQGATPDVEPEFRYPGPKPQTKETAILMLADGVEAASRTLEDPSPARIR